MSESHSVSIRIGFPTLGPQYVSEFGLRLTQASGFNGSPEDSV